MSKTSITGKKHNFSEEIPLTKDCQVRLFQDKAEINCIPGEIIHAYSKNVEDSKAHPGQYGILIITNIRLIWYMPRTTNVNIFIGYHTIQGGKIFEGFQKGIGYTESLLIRCKESNRVYEFIFVSPKSDNLDSPFRYFDVAYRNYCSSSLLREQKLRSSFFRDNKLILLKNEQVMLTLDGISNFSGEIAKLGSAIVTNYRFVWYSEVVSNFNVSIPLILLPEIKLTNSKRYGSSFILSFFSLGFKYMYGFTMQPEEKLSQFVNSFEKIRFSALQSPVLTPPLSSVKVLDLSPTPTQKEEDTNLIETDPALRYLPLNETIEKEHGIAFDKVLGLAIEQLPDGVTMTERWKSASETPLIDVDSL